MNKSKAPWLGLLVGALLGSITSASAADSQDHGTWRAKDSWISRLSLEEVQQMMGLQKPPQGRLDFESVRTTGAPTSLDWRNVNGVNWLGPVMNQGNCGSCVAFSTVATLEAQTSIAAGVPWLRPSFSPQALFACGGGTCHTGWMPDSAASFLEQTGIPDEACMPYTSGSSSEDVACSHKCGDASSRSMRIAGSHMPTSYGGSVDDVKAALKNGPLVTTLMVYADFVTYGSGVYKHVKGPAVGGHAVSLVGYDDAKRAWLIRNSWGAEWGENGFGWISWDDSSGVGADTWAFDVTPSTDHITVASPSDREFVSGKYQLVAQSQGNKAQEIEFFLQDASGREAGKVACAAQAGQPCSAKLDTTQLREGRYEIFAQSSSNGTSLKSQAREFFVINSEPKLSLSFKPVDGVDLGGDVKDRPEFNITAKFSPVPFQRVEFRAIDSNGKIAAIKGNDFVLEQMKMGWRTATVPNGKYTILFHGETKYNGKTYSADSNSYQITVKN